MAIEKKTHYSVYNDAIEEGRELVRDFFDGEDVLDLALNHFTPGRAKAIERSGDSDLEEFIKNYLDGLEDGCRSQLHRELMSFKKWLRDADAS